ncbi:hypothetical protein SAMN04489712_105287 [Thermomonospora echinospora]|uniref:Uncharacterized protein n=1 Tax=Thermomonospora echinospora TaxID=1992 RepID=A0A1H6AAA3_9ACTN|nr:hypothetical protein [Thermomonospora echinospora]SEG45124.1 hypothetical protein SAMN04489712_105287 [Thermomonospora echinospora]
MGSGWRDWQPGDTVTEPFIQGYLQDQTVMVFASGTARDAAITSPQRGMCVYLLDTKRFSIYESSAPAGWISSIQIGEWSTYTPQLLGSIQNFGAGNGSATGRWARWGSLVTFYAEIVYGSTSTSALGNLSMTLPATGPRTGNEQWVDCSLKDASAGRIFPGQAGPLAAASVPLYTQSGTGGSLERMTDISPAGQVVTNTGDAIRMWGQYEVAV